MVKLYVKLILCSILLSFVFSIFSYAEIVDWSDKTIPTVYMTVENYRALRNKNDYVTGTIEIIHDNYGLETMPMQIKVRGNSTAGQPKKPYHIRLDSSTDLFGMGKNRHWLLLADALDRTHLRNRLAFDLAENLGVAYTKSTYAEVYLNGDYIGLYMLCEQIRVGKTRVDIFDWENFAEDVAKVIAKKEGRTGEDLDRLVNGMQSNLAWITTGTYKSYKISDYYDLSDINFAGGYLIENDEYYDEVSKFRTQNEMLMMIQEPEYLYTNSKMFEYIQTYIQDLEDSIYSNIRYNKDGIHYTEYMDLESFIDFWIVFESFKNVELLFKSCYMYKDIDEKLVFGPVWDFDWSSGNHVVLHSDSKAYDKWHNTESQNRAYWYKQLYSDPFFVTRLKERWNNSLDLLYGMILSIDTYSEYLTPYVANNVEVWGNSGISYEREIDELKTWLINRVEWMNTQLSNENPDIMGLGWETDNSIEITQVHNDDTIIFTINCAEDTNKIGIFLNGIIQPSIDLIDGMGTFEIDINKPLPNQSSNDNTYNYIDNVLTIWKYNNENLTPSSMNFTIFQIEPPEDITVIAESKTSTGSPSLPIDYKTIGIIISIIVLLIVGYVFVNKKVISKKN